MIHIVLYKPEKPANTGNILRSANALSAHVHVIGPLTFKLDTDSLKRTGLDYIHKSMFTYYESYEDFNKAYPHADIYYITRYGSKPYSDFDFSKVGHNYFLMFGSESSGIPYEILRNNRDRLLRIPMAINTRSLNLANAVAVVAYEVARQQNFKGLSKMETIKGDDFL